MLSSTELSHSILINGWANSVCPSLCNHLLWLTRATSVQETWWSVPQMTRLLSSLVPAHVSGLDQTPVITSVMSLIRGTKFFFSIHYHSYFFTLVKLSCFRLSDSQGEKHAKFSRGWKKEKGIADSTASRLMNTKPLCLSYLEIGRWKLLWHISFFQLTFLFLPFFKRSREYWNNKSDEAMFAIK